jgi:hypothetical protein
LPCIPWDSSGVPPDTGSAAIPLEMFFPPFVSLGQTNVFRGASRPGAHHSLPALAPPVAVVVVDQVSTLRNRLDCSTWGNRAW